MTGFNLYDKNEAAKILRMNVRTLERHRAEKRIRGIVVARKVLFSAEELQRFLISATDQFELKTV